MLFIQVSSGSHRCDQCRLYCNALFSLITCYQWGQSNLTDWTDPISHSRPQSQSLCMYTQHVHSNKGMQTYMKWTVLRSQWSSYSPYALPCAFWTQSFNEEIVEIDDTYLTNGIFCDFRIKQTFLEEHIELQHKLLGHVMGGIQADKRNPFLGRKLRVPLTKVSHTCTC